MSNILVIEDEDALSRLLTRLLEANGFDVTVAETGSMGLAKAITMNPDLVILDLMLPDVRGQDVLTRLMAAQPDSRVLVLSSVPQIGARVEVLSGGAADFLAKPFANAELLARIKARMRKPAGKQTVLRQRGGGRFVVDAERHELIAEGRRIKFSPREFVLLAHLLERAPQVCSRNELLSSVWGEGYDTNTNVVDVYVKRLRTKLKTMEIETVRNVGYRFITA